MLRSHCQEAGPDALMHGVLRLGPKKTAETACYPGEPSVTFYPRAVMKDAAAYLRVSRSSP